MSDEQYVTQTGKVLTDSEIDALADEAERGYDVSALKPPVEDAYAAHVERLRAQEREEATKVKIARLEIPQTDMAEIALLIHDVLKQLPEGTLTNMQTTRWNSIIRQLNQAVQDAT